GPAPPTLGCAWQARQLFELKRGPRPLFWPPVTDSICANLVRPSWKNAFSSAVRAFREVPAPAAPPRTPGSTGAVAGLLHALSHTVSSVTTIPARLLQAAGCLFFIGVPHVGVSNNR